MTSLQTTPGETVEQYKARLVSITEGKDPLEIQSQTPAMLASLVKGRDAEALRRNPQPGKWSVAQIVAHLSETETAAFWRYRQMLEHNGSNIIPYDQDLWEKLG